MAAEDEGFENMTRMQAGQIWAFLRRAPVGRIATHDHGAGITALTPLFFAYRAGRIYFSTQPGRKLALLRLYPAGVALQCDEERAGAWTSVLAWGRYRDVPLGREQQAALLALGLKYRERYLGQIAGQALKALRGGPLGVLRAVRGATVGCLDLERVSGRIWRSHETA
ncbi:MAG TPA: pyridoxamine 5'-phosphate oxidase family protein [Herpetosiphonaceae bacterium]